MLAETVQEWAAPWVEKGREEGLEKGRAEERAPGNRRTGQSPRRRSPFEGPS